MNTKLCNWGFLPSDPPIFTNCESRNIHNIISNWKTVICSFKKAGCWDINPVIEREEETERTDRKQKGGTVEEMKERDSAPKGHQNPVCTPHIPVDLYFTFLLPSVPTTHPNWCQGWKLNQNAVKTMVQVRGLARLPNTSMQTHTSIYYILYIQYTNAASA